MIAAALGWLLLALVVGSMVYCLLVLRGVASYLGQKPGQGATPPLSVLKPLAGVDLGLEENLRSFFTQDYPDFEILFAVREADDPAVPLVHRLCAEYPQIPARLVLALNPPFPNAKVHSLDHMIREAKQDLLVMSDSDIRVTPDMLRVVAAEFADPEVVLTTCPYRAVGGPSIWSKLEAAGMNTEFLAGVLVARLLEGMHFALGPTISARRSALDEMGGVASLGHFLAEDFVMGQRAALTGRVLLSSYVIEHRIGSQRFRSNFLHRIRWGRSTRRSRPAGYAGQIFINPTPLALLLWLVWPGMAPVAVAALALRIVIGWTTAVKVLADRRWSLLWLAPLQDLLSFFFWIAGFFGNTILWRGRTYQLHRDGRFELLSG